MSLELVLGATGLGVPLGCTSGCTAWGLAVDLMLVRVGLGNNLSQSYIV